MIRYMVEELKPITYKIQVKSPETEYMWKDLPNMFNNINDVDKFNNEIPRHVSHRVIKETREVIKEHDSDHAHYVC